jgi:hypothetical protein
MKPAPITLFTYNRPWHTQQTVETLQKNELADVSDLIIFSDGPKSESDRENVQAVRDYLQTIDGFKSVKIIEQELNKGLAASIISGVSEVVSKFGKIIVLEDDLLISPDFLRFMNEALEYYSEDNQVMQVSGHMFNVNIDYETDGIFLPMINSWGWATRQRAWDYLDPQMSGYEIIKKDKTLRKKFNLDGSYNYFGMLEAQINGKIDSWAIRWYLSVFLAKGLILYPKHSLVKHIGFDGSGTHCGNSSSSIYAVSLGKIDTDQINFPKVSLNLNAYSEVIQYLSSQKSFKAKLKDFFCKFKYGKKY